MSYFHSTMGCCQDKDLCIYTMCCVSCQISRQCTAVKDDRANTFRWGQCILGGFLCLLCAPAILRAKVSDKFNLDEPRVKSCCCGIFCCPCSLCMTGRELKFRGLNPGGSICISIDDPRRDAFIQWACNFYTLHSTKVLFTRSKQEKCNITKRIKYRKLVVIPRRNSDDEMDENFYLPPSLMDFRVVNEVQFEAFSAEKIQRHAVCRVYKAFTLINGEKIKGGLSDPAMGTTDRDQACETCKMMFPECPGHFGYMELAEPMFNIGFFELVIKLLRAVCKKCFGLLLNVENEKVSARLASITHLTGVDRLREVVMLCNKLGKCAKCNHDQPNVCRFTNIYPGLVIRVLDRKSGSEVKWYGKQAFEILDGITDEDARILGFDPLRSHPRNLVLKCLPIPPPAMRPAVTFGSGVSENELTTKLISICRLNLSLTNAVDEVSKENIRVKMQADIASYFNNASTYYPQAKVSQSSKTVLKSIYERLKGKQGRLRGNLMGKRVNFSSRTVITGDPNIDVDEVGVPYSIAMTLTFPERVNHFNRARLTETVRRTNYPSANAVVNRAGNVLRLSALKEEKRKGLNLEIGDIVERHVVDGDVVLFNRQPSLHRMSMMGHRVRVLNFNTFRLNLSCTTPYNADFDGDEMNLHVPQSLLTKAELIEMMMVPKNFVSPNKSSPCMGIVQDALLGSFSMSEKEVFLDKYFMHTAMMWLDIYELPIPAILKPRPLWSGKQLFSLTLPPDVNWGMLHRRDKSSVRKDGGDKNFPLRDDDLLIQRGRLIYGRIKKAIIGPMSGSLIHVIFNEKGSDKVADFINAVQRVTTLYLYTFSFSVGMQDAVVDDETLSGAAEIMRKSADKVSIIAAKANEGKLPRKAGMTLLQSFESEVNTIFNASRESIAAQVEAAISQRNSFRVMIGAGSKGSNLNVTQISAIVGQQNVTGSRIPFGFRRRTLPHFMLDDYSDASRGLVARGYVEGLRPHEFFFHMMAGREGLIDTAVKTAETGYFQRKLMKAFEDLHIAYDGTVRNGQKEVVQFTYGEDGLEGSKIEGRQEFDIMFYSDEKLKETFRFEYGADGMFTNEVGGSYMKNEVKDALRKDPENWRILQEEFERIKESRKVAQHCLNEGDISDLKMWLPVNVQRLINNAQNNFGKRAETSNLNPVFVIEKVQDLIQDLKRFFPTAGRSADGTFTNIHNALRVENALKIFTIHLQSLLASKRVIKEHKLNEKGFLNVLGDIRLKYSQSIACAGEMIGALTAQSCGEPATQMTLNTFHNAGISSKNVTLGVPRLVEILSVSKNQRNTSMIITLRPPWNGTEGEKNAAKASHMCEYATLGTITNSFHIIFDPDPSNPVIEEDANELVLDLDFEDADVMERWSPWVVRLLVDEHASQDKQIESSDIKAAIMEYGRKLQGDIVAKNRATQFDDELEDPTANIIEERYHIDYLACPGKKNRVFRIRLLMDLEKETVPVLKTEIPAMLAGIKLAGIKGVTKAFTKKIKRFIREETGEIPRKGIEESAVDTEGSALVSIFNDFVEKDTGEPIADFCRTSTDCLPELFNVLGIEATRIKIIQEMRSVYGNYSIFINYRHYSVLADSMCHRGYMMAVNRVGVNKSGAGPLMRASFEQSVGVLMEAAAFSERDPVRAVSGNIMVGKQAKIGTGIFDLMVNIPMLQDAVSQEDAVKVGVDVNMYHGASSIVPASSVMLSGGALGQTPNVHAMSVLPGGGGLRGDPPSLGGSGNTGFNSFRSGIYDGTSSLGSMAYGGAASAYEVQSVVHSQIQFDNTARMAVLQRLQAASGVQDSGSQSYDPYASVTSQALSSIYQYQPQPSIVSGASSQHSNAGAGGTSSFIGSYDVSSSSGVYGAVDAQSVHSTAGGLLHQHSNASLMAGGYLESASYNPYGSAVASVVPGSYGMEYSQSIQQSQQQQQYNPNDEFTPEDAPDRV